VAFLGGSILTQNIGALSESIPKNLSNLLFLEGTIIFAIGIFIAVIKAWREPESSPAPVEETLDDKEQTREKRMNKGVLLMIVGVILMGLAIIVAPPMLFL